MLHCGCMHVCRLHKSLFPDLFVIVVNLCRCAKCQWTFISEEIDRYEYKITLYTLQNYGWPAGPATI